MNIQKSSNKWWRVDVTGLRAIAVIPVLLYHAFQNFLPGGFLGVDVFFVISGYLISGIIFRQLQNDNFSFKDFYERRLRRIAPNLILVLLFVLCVGWNCLLSSEFKTLSKHSVAGAFFVQNFALLLESGYFTEAAHSKPLLHLWSLSIEEQFYIIFPALVWAIWKLRQSAIGVGIVVVSITVVSFLLCILWEDKSVSFYFSLTRFWEIGIGICIAYIEKFKIYKFSNWGLNIKNLFSVIGLVAIVLPFVTVQHGNSHPGFVTLFPVIGTAMILVAGPSALINRTLLANRIVTYIGLTSYSLYLWHWPFLSFLFICIPQCSDFLIFMTLCLSFIPAILVYHYVENPLRRTTWIPQKVINILCIVGVMLVVLLASVLYCNDGAPNRKFNLDWNELENVRAWINWRNESHINYQGMKLYVYPKNSFPSILLVGDSHAEQYWLRMKEISRKTNKSVGIFFTPGCYMLSSGHSSYKYINRCVKSQAILPKLVGDDRIKTVVVSEYWSNYYKTSYFLNGMERLNQLINDNPKKNFYVILSAPHDTTKVGRSSMGVWDPLQHFNRLGGQLSDFYVPIPKNPRWLEANEDVRANINERARVIDPTNELCPDGICFLLAYKDHHHLNPYYVREKASWLDEIFQD